MSQPQQPLPAAIVAPTSNLLIPPPPVVQGRLELPQDRPIQLFVLMAACYMATLKFFTGTVYELEVKNQEIDSLTRLPRDVHKARVRDLAARKRHYGTLDEVPNETILHRPPNWFMALVIFTSTVAIISAMSYYNAWAGAVAWWGAYGGYLVVGVIMLVAFALIIRYRGKRPKN